MKKIIGLFLLIIITMESVFAVGISAQSGIVIETNLGRVLYEKNSDEKMGMASTTKIMTALVAIEKGKMSDVVEISAHSANIEGSSMYLKEGERITLENLLYGLMLQSGNDSATAIAEHIAGSEEKFAEMMNKKAEEIGAENTHFTNPHGLADEKHYTTARDLGKITAYAMKNPDFARIVGTVSKTIERETIGKQTLVNHNKLLKTYEGCIGVKTGFTKATGRCLVSASKRSGLEIVCVTLRAGDDWNDHKKMSDYAFENYRATLYGRCGTVAGETKVSGGKNERINGIFSSDIYLLEENEGEWRIETTFDEEIEAPVKQGEIIGKVTAISKNGEKQFFEIEAEKDIDKTKKEKRKSFGEKMAMIYEKWCKIFIIKY